ncbi:hypothetical protein M9Y10_001172 [Tritrichomonas musculus]|uniref:Uncharacterized protein n=1 Tax=Tritrichomonas musculus TaxID=1915356 RepID=A0ABR2L9G7_9EUKA
MEEEVHVPQGLAMFESSEAKEPIDFELTTNEYALAEGRGEDNFYDYKIRPCDIPCNGTLIIKNEKTGKLEAIPIQNYFLISRQCKIHEFRKLEATDTAALVNQFGTRQAKRFYNMRLNTSKT